MKKFNFYKEQGNRWFINLPDWEGDKDDLEMVMGADTMLDILAQGEDNVSLSMSDKPFESYDYLLTLKEEIYEGGMYELSSTNFNFDVWLCFVTKFVFGEFPNKIYLK
jgi:hypothetical protein